jgi:hypothetical protein
MPHVDLFEWAEQIDIDTTPRPFVAIWPRGRGKSTVVEIIASDLGAREKRSYCLYVCETQEQADKHVSTIKNMLESEHMAKHFPDIGNPQIGKHGSQNWRRSLMTTATGYSVEAIGLNKAIRGQKIDWARPDLIIFDDIDGKHDTEDAIKKKQNTITTSVLPSGARNCAVLFVQNLIHDDSIAHRLSKKPLESGAADYLANRIISGPFKAVDGLEYELRTDEGHFHYHITAGVSLWDGFGLDVCEAEMNLEGPIAFELESQHEIDTDNPLALLSSEIFALTRVSEHPDLAYVGVGVDPMGGAGQCGIVAAGKAKVNDEWHGFTLEDATTKLGTGAADWGLDTLKVYVRNRADMIYVEDNFGGDMVENNIRQSKWKDSDGNVIIDGANVPIMRVHASRGKEVRAQPVATVFQLGRGHHVGHFPELEKQWTRWTPGTKPSPDRLDAETWVYTGLGLAGDGWGFGLI